MTTQQKETLLEALNVIRSLTSELQTKLTQKSRAVARQAQPHLRHLATKGVEQFEDLKEHLPRLTQAARQQATALLPSRTPSRKTIATLAFGGVAAILVASSLRSGPPQEPELIVVDPSAYSSPTTTLEHQETSAPQKPDLQKLLAKIKTRITAVQAESQLELQKKQRQHEMAKANLALEKKRRQASAQAWEAKVAALQAEHDAQAARRAASRASSNRSTGSALLGLGSTRSQPIELGYGTSPNYGASQSANRQMQRYQSHMSGIMAARGVR